MKEFSIVFGASLLGWLVSEFIFMLSHPDPTKPRQVPLGINVACAVAFGFIACGLVS